MALTLADSKPAQSDLRRVLKEKATIEAVALRAMSNIAARTRAATLRAYRVRVKQLPVLNRELAKIVPVMTSLMSVAHLNGYIKSIERATPHLANQNKAAAVFDNALRFATDRLSLTPDQIEGLLVNYGDVAINVTRKTTEFVEGEMKIVSRDITESGVHPQEGARVLRAKFEALGLETQNPYLLETLVRNQTQVAYEAGRWEANQDPVIADILWGYEYAAIIDSRQTPFCDERDGTRLPKEDQFWLINWPPNHWGCRSTTLEIFKGEEIAQEKLPGELTELPDGFKQNTGIIHSNFMGTKPAAGLKP